MSNTSQQRSRGHSASSTRPSSRYNSDRDLTKSSTWTGKVIAIALVILVVALVLGFTRFIQLRDEKTVTASMAGFERIDDSLFQMDLDVSRKNVDQPSYCIVTALNYSKAEVGRREVLVPSGGNSVIRLTTQIPTREAAVSGGVYGCSTNIPAHMNL